MRAHTITTMTRPTSKAWQRAVALVLAVCSLAIPASASAQGDYSTPNAITGGSESSSQPVGGSGYSSVNAVMPPSSESSAASGSQRASSGYSSLNALSGSSASEPTFVSGLPSISDDGFDWGDAALGAGGALALLALSGVVFLAVRRRMAVAPTTASMS